MTTRETLSVPEGRVSNQRVGMSCRFADIAATGFWVNNLTGEGYRMTEDSMKTGHSPIIGYVSDHDQFTLVNPDPYAPIGKLRKNTADLDLPVRF